MSRERYDYIFSSALALQRHVETYCEPGEHITEWMGSVAALLFVVINEWEREDRKIPDTVMEAARRAATAWEDMTVDAAVKVMEEIQE